MSRKRSRKVLYEVSTEAQKARSKRPKLEITRRARAFKKKVISGRAVDIKEKSAIKPVGLKRNFIVLVSRLMNFSVKKAIILLVILIVVIKLLPDGKTTEPVEPEVKPGTGFKDPAEGGGEIDKPGPEPAKVDNGVVEPGPEVAGPPKDHYIVIASHKDVDQLKALAGFFAVNGIDTEIKLGSMNTLITKDRYFKPGDPQTKIEEAKAKIKKVGAKYKPEYNSGYLRYKFDGIYEKKEE